MSLFLYLVTAGISGRANHLISQQAGQESEKISDMNAQESEKISNMNESESQDDTIAVIMSVSNVTPTGLTVHFRQYDKRDNIGP